MINVNLTGIRACVFDAYGTLFDVNSAAQRTQNALRDKWQQFAEVWRAKQLQCTWLRSQLRAFLKYFLELGARAIYNVILRMIMTGQGINAHYDPIDIIGNMVEEHLSSPVFQTSKDFTHIFLCQHNYNLIPFSSAS